MSNNSYKVKYLKYKRKYLNLLEQIENNGGSVTGKLEQASTQKEEKKTDGVTSAINGRLGIAKDIREGTAGDGELCLEDKDCPSGFCDNGNCGEKKAPKPVKKLTEEEEQYLRDIEGLRQLVKLSEN